MIDGSKFLYKQTWFFALRQFVSSQKQQYEKVMVLGDFNIAPADTDVYDEYKWNDKILCSVDERCWFQHIFALGLSDSFRMKRSEDVQSPGGIIVLVVCSCANWAYA